MEFLTCEKATDTDVNATSAMNPVTGPIGGGDMNLVTETVGGGAMNPVTETVGGDAMNPVTETVGVDAMNPVTETVGGDAMNPVIPVGCGAMNPVTEPLVGSAPKFVTDGVSEPRTELSDDAGNTLTGLGMTGAADNGRVTPRSKVMLGAEMHVPGVVAMEPVSEVLETKDAPEMKPESKQESHSSADMDMVQLMSEHVQLLRMLISVLNEIKSLSILASNEPSKKTSQTKKQHSKRRCYVCRERGHSKRDCPKKTKTS